MRRKFCKVPITHTHTPQEWFKRCFVGLAAAAAIDCDARTPRAGRIRKVMGFLYKSRAHDGRSRTLPIARSPRRGAAQRVHHIRDKSPRHNSHIIYKYNYIYLAIYLARVVWRLLVRAASNDANVAVVSRGHTHIYTIHTSGDG